MTEELPKTCGDFEALTPDRIVDSVEAAVDRPLVGFTHPLTSYINRVYELQCVDKTRIIVKFYRPGRWSKAAIEEEHAFVRECAKDEIPVVAPFPLKNGSSLGQCEGIHFAVYPKRLGRQWEPCSEEDWRRLGRLLARLHAAGSRQTSEHRLRMTPAETTERDIAQLLDGDFIQDPYREAFAAVADTILKFIKPFFDNTELIRIHGDCHSGNILERPEEGLMLIDFDDMVSGPPVQDLWMLLPDRADRARGELKLILEGYRLFRDFESDTITLIEPLRTMRMLYFQAWISRQFTDPSFKRQYPEWGTSTFWANEISALREQLAGMQEVLGIL